MSAGYCTVYVDCIDEQYLYTERCSAVTMYVDEISDYIWYTMTREQLKDYRRWYSVGADGCENDYRLLWVLPTDQYERLDPDEMTDNRLITRGIEDDSIYYVYYSPSDRGRHHAEYQYRQYEDDGCDGSYRGPFVKAELSFISTTECRVDLVNGFSISYQSIIDWMYDVNDSDCASILHIDVQNDSMTVTTNSAGNSIYLDMRDIMNHIDKYLEADVEI